MFILMLVVSISLYLALKVNTFLFIPLTFALIYGSMVCLHLFKHYNKRSLVTANWGTIKLQAGYCILMIMSFILKAVL